MWLQNQALTTYRDALPHYAYAQLGEYLKLLSNTFEQVKSKTIIKIFTLAYNK